MVHAEKELRQHRVALQRPEAVEVTRSQKEQEEIATAQRARTEALERKLARTQRGGCSWEGGVSGGGRLEEAWWPALV